MHTPRYWQIQAARDWQHDGWQGTEHLPTFYLDSTVQGFTDENGARDVALRLLGMGARIVSVVPSDFQPIEEGGKQ